MPIDAINLYQPFQPYVGYAFQSGGNVTAPAFRGLVVMKNSETITGVNISLVSVQGSPTVTANLYRVESDWSQTLLRTVTVSNYSSGNVNFSTSYEATAGEVLLAELLNMSADQSTDFLRSATLRGHSLPHLLRGDESVRSSVSALGSCWPTTASKVIAPAEARSSGGNFGFTVYNDGIVNRRCGIEFRLPVPCRAYSVFYANQGTSGTPPPLVHEIWNGSSLLASTTSKNFDGLLFPAETDLVLSVAATGGNASNWVRPQFQTSPPVHPPETGIVLRPVESTTLSAPSWTTSANNQLWTIGLWVIPDDQPSSGGGGGFPTSRLVNRT